MTTTTGYDVLAADAADVAACAPLTAGGVNVGRLHDGPELRVRTIALDGGSSLPDHVAGVPVLIHVVEGRVRLEIGGAEHELTAGAIVRADAAERHSVHALEPARLVLALFGAAGAAG